VESNLTHIVFLFVFVLCIIYCQFLWIVHCWLPHRYSLTFTFIDPGKPAFVHTTPSSESVILVEWDQPCPVYGEIVNYDIKYISINMEDDQNLYEGCLVNRTSDKIQEMKSNITSFNLTELAYWTSYNICVSAFTTIGQGEENCTIEKTEVHYWYW